MEPSRKKLKTGKTENFETDQLRSTLPELPDEVLTIIFGYLTNSIDLIHVSRATKRFAKILEPSKVKRLFGEAYEIILKNEKKKNRFFSWTRKLEDICSIRLVCKSWRRSIDNILESHPSHFIVDWRDFLYHEPERFNAPFPYTLYLDSYEISDLERKSLQQFTNYFLEQQKSNPQYNPIPSRRFHIQFHRELHEVEFEKYSEPVSNYLHAFGRHIWYLTVKESIGVCDEGWNIIYPFLCKWAELMPNLKFLAFDFCDKFPCVREEKVAPLFPYLKYLEDCQFGYHCDTAYHVLKSNTQVRKIMIKRNTVLPKIMDIDFINPLDLILPEVGVDHIKNFRSFPRMVHTLSLECEGQINIKRLMAVFRMLKKSTIQSLVLDVSYFYFNGEVLEEVLDLPQLKHLHVKFSMWWVVDLDWFLGNLESLETLTLEIPEMKCIFVPTGYERSDEEDEQVNNEAHVREQNDSEDEVSEGEDESQDGSSISDVEDEPSFMHQFYHATKIWDNLPNLQTVVIKTDSGNPKQFCSTLYRTQNGGRKLKALKFCVYPFPRFEI